MTDGWGPVINAFEAFLVKYPEFGTMRDQMLRDICATLAPRSEDALALEREDIPGLSDKDNLIRHLNINAAQGAAHYRTMMGGVGVVLDTYRDRYAETVKMVRESEETPEPKVETIAETGPVDLSTEPTTVTMQPTPPQPQPKGKRR